jgi:hypothetical protein
VADTPTMIRMTHPEIPDADPATTTEEAFRRVWAPRGWEKADEATVAAGELLGEPVPNLEGLTKAQLLEVAANMGIDDVSGSDTKATIIEAIQAANPSPEEA